MPKLHPSYYNEGTQGNLMIAVQNLDGDMVYSSLKAGARAEAEHLNQLLLNPGYDVYKAEFSYCAPHIDLEDKDRVLFPSTSYAEPKKVSEAEFNELHQDITETLLMRGAPALGKVRYEANLATTPADLAFTPPVMADTGYMGSRSALVLMALACKGDWKPNLNQAFRDQIGVDREMEDQQRSALAQHATQLITEVNRRMDDPHDIFGHLARTGVEEAGRMHYWKHELPKALQAPEKFPRPTDAARELFSNGYKKTFERTFGRPLNMSFT